MDRGRGRGRGRGQNGGRRDNYDDRYANLPRDRSGDFYPPRDNRDYAPPREGGDYYPPPRRDNRDRGGYAPRDREGYSERDRYPPTDRDRYPPSYSDRLPYTERDNRSLYEERERSRERGPFRREEKKGNPDFYCELCNSQCTGKQQFEEHINGKQHKEKVAIRPADGAPQPAQSSASSSIPPPRPFSPPLPPLQQLRNKDPFISTINAVQNKLDRYYEWDDEKAWDCMSELSKRSFLLKGLPSGISFEAMRQTLANVMRIDSSRWKWYFMEGGLARMTFFDEDDCDEGKFNLQDTFVPFYEGEIKRETLLRVALEEAAPVELSLEQALKKILTPKQQTTVSTVQGKQYDRTPSKEHDKCAYGKEVLKRVISNLIAQQEETKKAVKTDSPQFVVLPGNRFGYSTDHLIGTGSEAEVYMGRRLEGNSDIRDPEWVAVKRMKIATVTSRGDAYNPGDAAVLKSIHKDKEDQHIVKFCQHLPKDEKSHEFIITELAVTDLYKVAELVHKDKQAFTPTDLRDLLYYLVHESCQAVKSLHKASIIHRDVRPQNFLAMADGSIKLTDFGFSRATTHNSTYARGEALQPYEVISSEAVRQKPTMPVDIFMLGMTICYLVAGKFPFGTFVETYQKFGIFNRESPENFLKELNDVHLQYLLRNMLSHDPQRRFYIEKVMNHPFFWSYAARENQIKRLNDNENILYLEAIQQVAKNHANWVDEVKSQALQLQIARVDKNLHPIRRFLRFLRNAAEHCNMWNCPETMPKAPYTSYIEYYFADPSFAWFLPEFYEQSWSIINDFRSRIHLHKEALILDNFNDQLDQEQGD